MAAGQLSKPGTRLGPCKRCEHKDCKESIAMASALCRFCAKAIGYDTPFFEGRFEDVIAHASCLEQAVEANDARVGMF